MPIRQDPSTKKWFYRFTRNQKSYFRGSFRTADQAKEAERLALDLAIRGELHPELLAGDLSFVEAGTLFIENYSKRHKKTWDIDVGRVAVLTQFFQEKLINRIVVEDVEAFLDWVKKRRQLKDHTLNHYLALLKCMYNWLLKTKKYRGDNPACAVPMKKVERARVRFLYPAEEKMLTPVIAQDAVLWPYYMVGLHTGMRLGEITRLKVKDISTPARTMFISHSKTGRSRYVPISEALAKFLEIR